MAKRCDCHRKREAAVKAGMEWWEAHKRFSKPMYHEHRCECACKCANDAMGYALCPSCHWGDKCIEKRREAMEVIDG